MPNKASSKSSIYDRKEPRKGEKFAEMRVNPPKGPNVKITHPEEHGLKPDGK